MTKPAVDRRAGDDRAGRPGSTTRRRHPGQRTCRVLAGGRRFRSARPRRGSGHRQIQRGRPSRYGGHAAERVRRWTAAADAVPTGPDLLPARTLDASLQTTLPPGSALPLTLPGGDKTVQVDLGAGVAAFAGGSTVWTADAPLSRTLTGGWTDILLVNTGTSAEPASLSWQPAPPTASLRPGSGSQAVLRRRRIVRAAVRGTRRRPSGQRR